MSDSIVVTTKEGKKFTINKKASEMSLLLKNTGEISDEVIVLNEVDEKSMELIIKYLNRWKDESPPEIEKPLKSNNMKEVTDSWSADFIDLDLDTLTSLTVSCNFLEINPLIDLACAKIASLCKDKDEDEILKTFGITETFNEEEKKRIREENKWIEDNFE